MMKDQLILIIAFTMLFACKKDESLSYVGFVPISEESVYDSLQVQENCDYYEIRNNYCFDSTRYDILCSEGTKPYIDSVFAAANEGVFYSRGDVCMYNTIFIHKGAESYFLTSFSEITTFLGPIDCIGDALFIAHLNGYDFKYNDEEFGIKKVVDGFLIQTCMLTSACAPFQIDKFLIRIDISGNIKILEQSVLRKDDHACI